MRIRIQPEDFDTGAEIARLRQHNPRVGGVVAFVGTVRDLNEGLGVATLTLEHYPGMTEKSLTAIATEACNRWRLEDLVIIHRVGELRPTDQIVLVAVASAHRGEAFAACEFLMDYLKTRAPFWKKEATPEGERWVEARDSDSRAADRWAR